MTHKKWFATTLLIIVTTFVLSGCGKATTTNTNTATNANSNAVTNTNQTANTNSQYGISQVELQRLPKGTTFTPGMSLTTTTSFSVGDQMAFNITGVFNPDDSFSYSFVNSTGQTTEQGAGQNLITGSNGSCCFAVPSTAGSYTLKVNLNGTEAKTVPVTITP